MMGKVTRRRVMGVVGMAAVALWTSAAAGQTVFFDDFDGNDLKPHWNVPPPSHWDYNVRGGMLNVTGLFWPGIPHFSSNYAIIGASYAPQADFRADVWMGWEAGDAPHGLGLYIMSPTGHFVAWVAYDNWGGPGTEAIFFGGGTQGSSIPAPAPGVHHFTITRVGAQFRFYLEGNLLATSPDTSRRPASGISVMFVGPSDPSATFGTLHIDRIRIVPAPASFVLWAAAALACTRRKRPGMAPRPRLEPITSLTRS